MGKTSADTVSERKEGNLAQIVLERVAGYIKPDPGVTPGDEEACERLVPEYYVLRTALVSSVMLLVSSRADSCAGVAS